MKVGDLVKFSNDTWIGPVPKMYKGCGLIEEEYSNGTFEVYWGCSGNSRTLGPEALGVIHEGR